MKKLLILCATSATIGYVSTYPMKPKFPKKDRELVNERYNYLYKLIKSEKSFLETTQDRTQHAILAFERTLNRVPLEDRQYLATYFMMRYAKKTDDQIERELADETEKVSSTTQKAKEKLITALRTYEHISIVEKTNRNMTHTTYALLRRKLPEQHRGQINLPKIPLPHPTNLPHRPLKPGWKSIKTPVG